MPNILVLYYSSYGHVEVISEAVAEGAAEVADVEVTIKRVPEIMTEEAAFATGFKIDQLRQNLRLIQRLQIAQPFHQRASKPAHQVLKGRFRSDE